MHDWSLLNEEKRSLIDQVLAEWEALLGNSTAQELDYQRFLEAHAGLFFSAPGTHILISKPEMSNEYVPDLVVVSDNESYGFRYELVELESPHDQVFRSDGHQSKYLTDAIQQIEYWRRWLEKNSEQGKRLFPSKAYQVWGDPQIRYTIIIGRRAEMEKNNENRLQKSENYGCDIRSFDYLTDKLRQQVFFTNLFAECDKTLSKDEINAVVSPFFCAMSSGDWKRFRSEKPFYNAHSMGFNARTLLKFRPDNTELLAKFVAM